MRCLFQGIYVFILGPVVLRWLVIEKSNFVSLAFRIFDNFYQPDIDALLYFRVIRYTGEWLLVTKPAKTAQ